MTTLAMTCWVDVRVAHEWPPIVDDLADALLLKLSKELVARGGELVNSDRHFSSGMIPMGTGHLHVVVITVMADDEA